MQTAVQEINPTRTLLLSVGIRDKGCVYIAQCLSLLLLFTTCSEPVLKCSLAPVSTVPPVPFGNVLGEEHFPGISDIVPLAFPPHKALSNRIDLASFTKK